jgi:hypothetical protein
MAQKRKGSRLIKVLLVMEVVVDFVAIASIAAVILTATPL